MYPNTVKIHRNAGRRINNKIAPAFAKEILLITDPDILINIL
jgi:hypothetical protein